MKRILKKAGILLLVFLLGTVGTALLLNSEFTDNRSDFNDAVFPEDVYKRQDYSCSGNGGISEDNLSQVA